MNKLAYYRALEKYASTDPGVNWGDLGRALLMSIPVVGYFGQEKELRKKHPVASKLGLLPIPGAASLTRSYFLGELAGKDKKGRSFKAFSSGGPAPLLNLAAYALGKYS